MDLSSLTPRPGVTPGDFDNPHVETRIAFDEHNRPYLVAVPSPVPAPMPGEASPRYVPAPAAHSQGSVTLYQPIPPYYAPVQAPQPYSPVRDPWVCRLLASGAAVTGACFGLSFLLAALAAAETALGLLLAVMVVGWLMTSGSGKGSGSGVNVRITNTNSSRRRR